MALEIESWAVSGGQSSARIARLQLQSATRSGNGIVEAGDLKVTELNVPGGAVQIASGGAVILGREAAFQGSYYAYNVGVEQVPITPTGSAGGRSDMVILRVEDPTIDGTPWTHDVTTDPIYYFRVLEGVAPNATLPPPGMTAIPLARIDIPPSTATITQDMIVDLRQMTNPRRQRELRVQRGGTQTDGSWDEAGNITDIFERWPQHDWTVTIPEWATQVQILGNWDGVFFSPKGGTSGVYDARGELRVGLIGSQALYTTPSAYNFNAVTETNGYRCSAANRDQIAIPASMRGETVQVRMYVKGTPGQLGRLVADNYANFSVDMEFLELPAPEAQL